jgi:hypothetical protein
MRIVLGALALAFAVVPGGGALGQATGQSTSPAPPAFNSLEVLKKPMLFYLAKGEPDSCGPGCSEWIAAEGAVDAGVVARFRAFLAKTRAAKLPIYLHSPGGLGERAYSIGRLIRERGMTIGVSRTLPEGCKTLDEQACNALKRSGQTLTAELNPLAGCNSACVYVLIAGKVRQVPPGARVGVHSSKPVRLHADGRVTVAPKASQSQTNAGEVGQRKYFREMGVDPRIVDIASKVPHESIRYLSRDEIASLGIDKREFQETRWMVVDAKTVSVRKLFVEAKGPDSKELRLGIVDLSCIGGRRTGLVYIRGLASDENGTKQKVRLEFANRQVVLPGPIAQKRSDDIDTGGSFDHWGSLQSLELLDAVAAQSSFDIVAVEIVETAGAVRRATKLSTAGLSKAIGALRLKCGGEAINAGATPAKP